MDVNDDGVPFSRRPYSYDPFAVFDIRKALQFINHNPKLKWISYFNDEEDHHLTSSLSSGEEEEFFTPSCGPSTTSDDKFKEEFFALVKKALLDNYNIDSKAMKDNKEHIEKMCKV